MVVILSCSCTSGACGEQSADRRRRRGRWWACRSLRHYRLVDFVRVTVASGDAVEVDVSLPADEPIVTWLPSIVHLLHGSMVMVDTAQPWAVAAPGGRRVDSAGSLASAGIGNGDRVELIRAEDHSEAAFADDVVSLVQTISERDATTWERARPRAVEVLGGMWIAAAAVALVLTCGWVAAAAGSVLLAAIGLAVAAVGRSVGTTWLAGGSVVACASAGYALGAPTSVQVGMIGAFAGLAVGVAFGAVARAWPASLGAAALIDALVLGVVGWAVAGGASLVAIASWGLIIPVVALMVAPVLALASGGVVAHIRDGDGGSAEGTQRLRQGRADVLVWASGSLALLALVAIATADDWRVAIIGPLVGGVLLWWSLMFSKARHVPVLVAAGVAAFVPLPFVVDEWLGLEGDASTASSIGAVLVLLGAAIVLVVGRRAPADR